MTARALVLSAETPSAVAVVRALHGAGFEVAALAESLVSPAAASWRCALPQRVGRWGGEDLVSIILDLDAEVVVPVSEADLLRLAPVRVSVERLAPVVAPRREVLDTVLDKLATGRAARDLADRRIAAPDEMVLRHGDSVGDSDEGDFPLVAKPRRSRHRLDDGTIWGDTARHCADPYDLREAHRAFALGAQDTLVQRPVHGDALLASVLLHADGTPALWFVHRRVRQARPEGGPSACAVSHAPSPEILEPTVALAQSLGVHGVPIQFEYVLDDAGLLVLLDVNPRPWGTLGLALDAGVDFYGVAARHAMGADLPATPPEYRVGLVRRYLPFEARHALAVASGSRRAGYAGPWPSGGPLALLRAGFLPGDALVFRSDDPLPAFADMAHHARRALRRD